MDALGGLDVGYAELYGHGVHSRMGECQLDALLCWHASKIFSAQLIGMKSIIQRCL